MTIIVCTGFNPAGYVEYGHAFLNSFHRHWHKDIKLLVYVERPIDLPRGECRSLWDCDGAIDFSVRHRANQEAQGKNPAHWRPKEQRAGYTYRFDAYKFYKQLMIPEHASKSCKDGDILVWLDADVMTKKDMPNGLIEQMLGDSDLVYFGRENFHPDIGFWAVRICPSTRFFLVSMAGLYRSDGVFRLPEWHSAYVFDHCRQRFERGGGRAKNLTAGAHGSAWPASPLNEYTVHLKGKLKAMAKEFDRAAQ